MAITTQAFIQAPFVTKNAKGVAAATVVKASKGYVGSVTVAVAGSSLGAIYDHATTSGVGNSNLIFSIPEAVGTYTVNFPTLSGITVVPGTGMTVAVSFA